MTAIALYARATPGFDGRVAHALAMLQSAALDHAGAIVHPSSAQPRRFRPGRSLAPCHTPAGTTSCGCSPASTSAPSTDTASVRPFGSSCTCSTGSPA